MAFSGSKDVFVGLIFLTMLNSGGYSATFSKKFLYNNVENMIDLIIIYFFRQHLGAGNG